MINKIEIKAPAKINIGLYVTEKRSDGFHNLETIFYPIKDLCDRLIFEKSDSFLFTCDDSSLPTDDSNLAVKAVRALEKHFNRSFNVSIHLNKTIPYGAGLGGGSSDAAAVLIALNDMYNLKLTYQELINISLELGSDVPFFIKTFPSIGKSRGEKLIPIDLDINKYILLVNPGIHISTKEAYSNIVPNKVEINWNEVNEKLNNSPSSLNDYLKNDFEEYALSKYIEIKDLKKAMLDSGAEFAQMTGSGSTVFGIFNTQKEVEKCLSNIDKNYFTFISNPENYY